MALNQPLTIGTLRDRHLSLMREWRELKGDGERLRRANEMRQMVAEAGQAIESPAERDEAQGIVDYWASTIAGMEGQAYPDILLVAPYAQAQAASAGESIREVYDRLQPPEAQRIARSILEELLVLGDHGVERDRPRSREVLRKSAGTTDKELFDRVLQSLVDSGAVVCRSSESRVDDCFEAVDGRIAESWPALQEWLENAKLYNAERGHLMEQAQQWSFAKKDSTRLLTGRAVENALKFKKQDELLDAYIDASNNARNKSRRLFLMVVVFALMLTSSALIYYIILVRQERAARAEAENARADAEKKRDEAEALLAGARVKNTEAEANAEIAQHPNALNTLEFEKVKQSISPAAGATTDAALEQLPALSGAMWLGSDKTPQVANLQGGDVGALARAMPGMRYRAKVQIYLRTAMPKSEAEYGRPEEKAIIPAGMQIVLLSQPRGFRRATGIQYWANVRIIPRVYVQFNNASPAQVNGVRQQLASAGFEVPAGELRRDYRDRAEVRYFQRADRPIARLLQRVANQIPAIERAGEVDCKSFAGPVGPSFKLELWYDARRRPSSAPARPCE